jgi:hypothetical protein
MDVSGNCPFQIMLFCSLLMHKKTGQLKNPYFLFVPHSTDSGGTGEYLMSMIVARAVSEQFPDALIRFVFHEDAPYARHHPFDATTFGGHHKDPYSRRRKNRIISSLICSKDSPSAVIFNESGRTKHYLEAFWHRVPVIFISVKDGMRRKGFKLGRLMAIDQHWMVHDIPGKDPASTMQKLFAKLFSVEIVSLPTLFLEPDEVTEENLYPEGADPGKGPRVLFLPGGGGYSIDGVPASRIFYDAASLVATRSGARCLLVTGNKHYIEDRGDSKVRTVPFLPNETLMSHVKMADLCVLGGGGVIAQALAFGQPVIAVPLGREEQRKRVRMSSAMGTVLSAEPVPEEIAAKALNVLINPETKNALIRRAGELGIGNGLPKAISGLKKYA